MKLKKLKIDNIECVICRAGWISTLLGIAVTFGYGIIGML